ncbi:uncharacterized protein VTP21DRAFT_4172 [Calcarisporiella thermophila]|uniref:uncharacterized protein n=1 Tax=Calcarisporiella thermophila TaxID=911321 RepID=UPI0037446237
METMATGEDTHHNESIPSHGFKKSLNGHLDSSHLPSVEGETGDANNINNSRPASTAETPAPDSESSPIECLCQQILVSPESRICHLCNRVIQSVAALQQDRLAFRDELEATKRKLTDAEAKAVRLTNESAKLRTRIEELEDAADARADELEALKRDLKILNEKYVDEIEKVAEIQHSKDMVENELEELSQRLFEEANGMVASEARQRHELQLVRNQLETQLQETRERLAAESQQLQELRKRMEEMAQQQPANATMGEESGSKRVSVHNRASVDFAELLGLRQRIAPINTEGDGSQQVDETLIAEFKEFITVGRSTLLKRLHSLPFMKHCLEEDIEPCLRFGSNPRVNPRKIADAILYNACFIEGAPPGMMEEIAKSEQGLRNSALRPMLWERFSDPGPFLGCQACGRTGEMKFRFRISSLDDWLPIDQYCRDRLVAVGEFYVFIRNLHQGLYESRSIQDLYAECFRLRLQMFYARLGAFPRLRSGIDMRPLSVGPPPSDDASSESNKNES